jgi:hypothetical protein
VGGALLIPLRVDGLSASEVSSAPPTHSIPFPSQVKNIAQIELGRHVMDTWYFSPYPAEFKDCKV